MAIRTSIAALGGVVMLFVGLFALGRQADIVRPVALNSSANGSSSAYNTTTGVLEGITGTAGAGAAWAGAAAFVLVAVGIAVVAYSGAR